MQTVELTALLEHLQGLPINEWAALINLPWNYQTGVQIIYILLYTTYSKHTQKKQLLVFQ